jgi:hypothetical protein
MEHRIAKSTWFLTEGYVGRFFWWELFEIGWSSNDRTAGLPSTAQCESETLRCVCLRVPAVRLRPQGLCV